MLTYINKGIYFQEIYYSIIYGKKKKTEVTTMYIFSFFPIKMALLKSREEEIAMKDVPKTLLYKILVLIIYYICVLHTEPIRLQ